MEEGIKFNDVGGVEKTLDFDLSHQLILAFLSYYCFFFYYF